jgi:hypothetical protein
MNTNVPAQSELPLEEIPADGRTFVNGSLWFVDTDGCRVVFHRHEVLYRIALGDVVHLRLVAVSLRQSGLATQEEIARAFGHRVITQARWERQYEKDGIEGLTPQRRPGRGPELDKAQERLVRRWFGQGLPNCQMAKRLGVDEATVRRTLKRLELARRPAAFPPLLPGIEEEAADAAAIAALVPVPTIGVETASAASAEAPAPAGDRSAASPEPCGADVPVAVEPSAAAWSLDDDPRDRSGDRALARLGLLADAVPLFADAECVPRAGVLLSVPLLVGEGLIEAFVKVYGSLQPSFYGLRTIVVTLFLAALLRIKRPEHFKEYRAEDLGAILGLDRAPEVKTVRGKFTRLAAMGRGKQLMEERARQRIAADEGDLRSGRLQPQAVRAADRRGVRRDHLPQGQSAAAGCASLRRAAAEDRGRMARLHALRPPPRPRGSVARRDEAETQAGQGPEEEAVSLDARGAGVARGRASDGDPRQPPGPVRRAGGLPHLRALASGELLQVHGRGVCLGCPDGIRGSGCKASWEKKPPPTPRQHDRPCGDSRLRTPVSGNNSSRPRRRSIGCWHSAGRSLRGFRPAIGRG